VALAGAAVVGCVVWGPFFLRQLHGYSAQDKWQVDEDPGFAVNWADRLSQAPMRLLAAPLTASVGASRLLWILVAMGLFLSRRRRRGLLLPTACLVLAILLPAAVDAARHTLMVKLVRYYAYAGPMLALVAAGVAFDYRRRWIGHAIPAAMALYCATSLPWTYGDRQAHWNEFGAFAARRCGPGDLLVFYTPVNHDKYSGSMYLAIDHYGEPAWGGADCLFMTGPASAEAMATLKGAKRALFLTDVPDAETVQTLMPGYQMTDSYYGLAVGYVCGLAPVAEQAK
jgi:hypothetical protein